jgi:hypothetical protein
MTSQGTDMHQLKQLSDLFWQFHNDRLNDPSLTDMTPYLQPVVKLIATERRKAAIEEREKIADLFVHENSALTYKRFKDWLATLSQEPHHK